MRVRRSVYGCQDGGGTSPSPFPLSVSSNGRYLVSAQGTPFRIKGDSAWDIMHVSLSDARTYLDDRWGRGFNALVTMTSDTTRDASSQNNPYSGQSGALPFLNSSGGTWDSDPNFRDNFINSSDPNLGHFDADFSRPVDAYWDDVDTIFRESAVRGICHIIDVLYMAFNQGANSGWWRTLSNTQNTQAVCYAFGQYLGARWRKHKNLILSYGTDMMPVSGSEASARYARIQDGLSAAGCNFLAGAHYFRSTDSLDYSDYASRMTINMVYPGAGAGGSHTATYGRCRRAYARSPALPVFGAEQVYDEDPVGSPRTREQVRSYGWWSQLSSTAGYVFGNSTIWEFFTGWQSHLGTVGTQDMQRMGAFFDALPWHLLVPDQLGSIGTLVTAGGGTAQTLSTLSAPYSADVNDGLDFVTAAATPDGSTLVAYVPQAHSGSVTIDMTKMRGTATCVWFDPTNATTTSIGSFSNTGTHAFTTPGTNSDGANDWVLRLLA